VSLHVAFLRGVGGPKPAPGAELRACFAAAGYDRVTPVIATGNVVFGTGRRRTPPDPAAISAMLEAHFGYALPAILRTGEAVAEMVAEDPFSGLDVGKLTRFIAMVGDDAAPLSALADPPAGAGWEIVGRAGRDIFFVTDRAAVKTPELMRVIERAFRKDVTTRNWNTIAKVAGVVAAG
jgi:uncharacterized protein (DUF1697 family)